MGAAKAALLTLAPLILLAARSARADTCTGVSRRGDRFATCFDVGNRLSLVAGSEGLGMAIGVRHEVTFDDDPDINWKMEHVMLEGTHSALDTGFSATVYRGRYMRHARDGHIVIPIGTPKKVFLPFDIGAIAELARIHFEPMDPFVTISMLRTAPLIDLARDKSYHRLFAFGPVAHWDMEIDHDLKAVSQHEVAPFTEGMLNVHLESADGLWVSELRVEAGTAWRSDIMGWKPEARASAELERVILSVNDRPIAMVGGIRYDSVRSETIAGLGLRFVLVDRSDPRVSLHPLKVDAPAGSPSGPTHAPVTPPTRIAPPVIAPPVVAPPVAPPVIAPPVAPPPAPTGSSSPRTAPAPSAPAPSPPQTDAPPKSPSDAPKSSESPPEPAPAPSDSAPSNAAPSEPTDEPTSGGETPTPPAPDDGYVSLTLGLS